MKVESVVQVVRGHKLNTEKMSCTFCDSTDSISMFCVVGKEKPDGTLLNCFGICKKHLDKLNALLCGEFDIDNIYIEKYDTKNHKGLQLRGFPHANSKNRK